MNPTPKTTSLQSSSQSGANNNRKASSTTTRMNKKPPQIRQTLTSYYRMLKVNPLLKYELEGKEVPILSGTKPDFSQSFRNSSINSSLRTILNKTNNNEAKPLSKAGATATSMAKTNGTITKAVSHDKPQNFKKPTSNNTTTTTNKNKLVSVNKVKTTKPNNTVVNMRRSVSADRSNSRQSLYPSRPLIQHKSAQSTDNIPVVVATESTPKFKSSASYERRSIASRTTMISPSYSSIKKNSLRRSSPPITPVPQRDLQNRLDSWLKKRGKSIGAYHHLKCFEVYRAELDTMKDGDGDNKENIEVVADLRKSASYQSLNIPDVDEPAVNKRQFVPKDDFQLKQVAKEALLELLKLITDGYDRDQCERWLEVIRTKYGQLQEESEYWECRAAIEQTRGDIYSAVECYKTAIMHGAEVDVVDKSLDNLLQKFSLLNINSNDTENETKDVKIIEASRNIFKSSIIQFAVRERMLKKNSMKDADMVKNKKFLATPVRRSTRISRGRYDLTPGIEILSTLHDLSDSFKDNMDFCCNKALQ